MSTLSHKEDKDFTDNGNGKGKLQYSKNYSI